MDAPKAFISYSWTSPDHENWVLRLATELRESGVDARLDKWHLREGQDSIQFMESMVADPEIKKVIIVSDKKYAEKSDNRTSGVGTEAQIISPQVYSNTAENKFVVVVVEKDENGKAYLPVYYSSRIYIDLSNADGYAQNFEQLLRWIYNKPVHIPPELGKKPGFLDDGGHTRLGTAALHTRVLDALRNGKPYSSGALDEYLNTFAQNLERFRMPKPESEPGEALIKNIGEFIPYRNEAIQLFLVIAQYAPAPANAQKLHRFFENLLGYMHRLPEGVQDYMEYHWDNYKFIVHELFLYALTILIDYEEYQVVDHLIRTPYYLKNDWRIGEAKTKQFDNFYEYISLLNLHNSRINPRQLDLRSTLLKERNSGTDVDFTKLMQTDFILFIRSHLNPADDFSHWFPVTLLHAAHSRSPFEIFTRASSKTYFDKIKFLLGIDKPSDLDLVLNKFRETPTFVPTWHYHRINTAALLGFDKLARKP